MSTPRAPENLLLAALPDERERLDPFLPPVHSIDERLCRWLRMTYNRARRTEFSIRHEFLAQMLGVHRPTVSTAASMVQEAGLISYRYGKLNILNPDGLAEGACECYQIMEAQFERIFDQPWRKDLQEPSFEHQ